MAALKIQSWDGSLGALSEENIRARYQPEYKYRIFRREMPEATRFAGEAEARTLVPLRGRFMLVVDGERRTVGPGELVEVPEGEFLFASEEPVSFLAIYKLPPSMWPN